MHRPVRLGLATVCCMASIGTALAQAATTAPATSATTAQVLPGSQIGFVSKQMGVRVEGQFRKFDARIALDPKQPAAGSVAFKIDLASATIGDKDTDAELAKAAWFDTARFPQASFQSSAIKAVGAGKFEVAGRLSIKGMARDVVVPVTVTQAGSTSTASGSFAIQRLAFKIGEGDWSDTTMVADEVQVKFKLSLAGLAPL